MWICLRCVCWFVCFFFFKQKTAYEMRISDWSSDVCSSDLGSLLGHLALGPLDVAGTEVEQGLGPDVGVVVHRGALAHARVTKVVEQPGHVPAGQVATQRPGRICVPDGKGQVRHALEHHALVGETVLQVDRFAVHGQLDAAEEQQLESGGRDDDVCLQLLPQIGSASCRARVCQYG